MPRPRKPVQLSKAEQRVYAALRVMATHVGFCAVVLLHRDGPQTVRHLAKRAGATHAAMAAALRRLAKCGLVEEAAPARRGPGGEPARWRLARVNLGGVIDWFSELADACLEAAERGIVPSGKSREPGAMAAMRRLRSLLEDGQNGDGDSDGDDLEW